MGSLGLLPGH
jgi:hypothetical protein